MSNSLQYEITDPNISIPVLLVDDDPMIRRFLRIIIEAAGCQIIAEVSDGDEVVEAVRAHRPTVVLMDIRMGRQDGIATTRQLRALGFSAGIIALTSFDTQAAVIDSVDAGVDGFLAKDASPEEIQSAIRNVAAKTGAISARAARIIMDHARSRSDATAFKCVEKFSTFTQREREVTALLVTGKSNPQIAAELNLGEATVKSHVSAAMEKSDTTNRVQLAVFAVRAGVVTP
ncbi:response regulator [Timonella sp. A28]|uniref:response regulator n=1 Tax=Timonella sp. A28 TaxID=3442640 RepID=UPI003EBB4EBD